MTREDAIKHISTASKVAIDNGYTSDVVDACAMAIKALEQEPCEDCISRKAVKVRLTEIINEMEQIFADIRERHVDDSVCGLCEYDCDHGIDGFANECPGFERDDCFKLKDEYRKEWESLEGLPSVNPQEPKTGYCEDCISRQAAIDALDDEITITGATNAIVVKDYIQRVKRKLDQLPSVNPQEPKTGHWIADVDRWGDIETTVNGYRCSECGQFDADNDNYCPNCGAKMESDG